MDRAVSQLHNFFCSARLYVSLSVIKIMFGEFFKGNLRQFTANNRSKLIQKKMILLDTSHWKINLNFSFNSIKLLGVSKHPNMKEVRWDPFPARQRFAPIPKIFKCRDFFRQNRIRVTNIKSRSKSSECLSHEKVLLRFIQSTSTQGHLCQVANIRQIQKMFALLYLCEMSLQANMVMTDVSDTSKKNLFEKLWKWDMSADCRTCYSFFFSVALRGIPAKEICYWGDTTGNNESSQLTHTTIVSWQQTFLLMFAGCEL